MARLVYRGGPPTPKNLTPRSPQDVEADPGEIPGLSTFDTMERAAVRSTYVTEIDLDLLTPPLAGFRDPRNPGHMLIAPADEEGNVDRALLRAWAETREALEPHELTMIVLAAMIRRIPTRSR